MTTQLPANTFDRVYDVILERKQSSPETSYVAYLMDNGTDLILKKICEESAEVVIAAKNENRKEQIHEIADLWFHLLVLMGHQEITLTDISMELERRFDQSGLEEKANR
ncbi:MAG: Phosphoribosyl-ATP pyrophosphatase [Deltaproteobacteria bacterium]|jgi:phosphoribosyl-ATP pyrophosphohydrolase|nr:Phosphoribosyl-ATP pyrophosphatase [Deltaproteobacteria bacterium]